MRFLLIMVLAIVIFAIAVSDDIDITESDTTESLHDPILVEHYDGMDLYAQPLNDGRVMYFYEISDGDCVRYRIISSTSIEGSFKPNF